MELAVQRNTMLSIMIAFSIVIRDSHQTHITLNTDNMKHWKLRSNNEQTDRTCEKSFRFIDRVWKLSSCKRAGTNACVLETGKYATNIVQELHIEIVVTSHRPRKDLVVGYKARDFSGRVHHRIHESSIQARSSDTHEIAFKHRINVTLFKDISFEFSNFYGYCGEIRSLVVSYHTCNYEKDSLVNPVVHGSPSIKDEDIRLNATCKHNAVPTSRDLYFTCSSNGNVSQHGGCMCLPGYRFYHHECVRCPKYTYKPIAGNQECTACGMHSYNSADRDECVCRHGYYREVDRLHDSSASCYSSKPLKLIITSITSDSAHIEWKVVNKSIEWKKIHFTMNCDNCLDNEGNFPFQTYRREIQLNDLEPSKKYVISVTASSEEGIIHTASTTIWGKFVTTHATYGKDIITITIISIIVPLVTITTTIFVYMYCKQKRKSDHLRKKITSLKRQRRPPKPPAASPPKRNNEQYDVPDEKHNISDSLSDINPYAVWVPPAGFNANNCKLSDKAASIRDIVIEMKDEMSDPRMKMLPCEQYEAMDGASMCAAAAATLPRKQNMSTENPYILPSWARKSPNQGYVDIKDADATGVPPMLQSSMEEDAPPRSYRMEDRVTFTNINDVVDEEEGRDVHRNMPLIPLRQRQLLNDRGCRATSLYKDVFNYATMKDIAELNAAKLNLKELNAAAQLNCHYMRYDRNKAMDFVAMIKRSHSADDINKLPLIL